jgi:hypothetical protein
VRSSLACRDAGFSHAEGCEAGFRDIEYRWNNGNYDW